jgi:hypothetical protein
MGPFAEVARVAELFEMERLPREEENRPTGDRGMSLEPAVEVERVVHFRVEREGLVTVARLLGEPYQQVSIGSDGMRPQIRRP